MTQPTTTSYTTIPISAADVISRSLQNLSATVSRLRPWPELLATGSFTRPDSFSSSLIRLRSNFHYFRINYAIIISACGALSLMASPISLLLFAFLFALWLLLHFFREDPLVLWDYHVSDRFLLLVLVAVSVVVAWASGGVVSLLVGTSIGLLISGAHAVFRNSDGLFLEQERSLIGSDPVPGYGSISGSAELSK